MENAMKTLAILSLTIYTVSAFGISNNTRQDSRTFFTIANIKSPFVCGMLCLQAVRCEAVNFRATNNTCFFLDQTSTSSRISETGYVSSNISSWKPEVAGLCQTKPCDNNSLCVPKTSSYNCITAAWAQ